jgi:spore maturation protein CgeB
LGASFRSALTQLGHEVFVADESWAYSFFDRRPFRTLWRPWIGSQPSARALFRRILLRTCARAKPQLVLATQGGALDAELLAELRDAVRVPCTVFSTDDPFNPNVSSPKLIEALPLWDAIFTPRKSNLESLRRHCPGTVAYLPWGYDPDIYFPERPQTEEEAIPFRSDVVFIGVIDGDRVPYLDPLAECPNLRVSFYGGPSRYTRRFRRIHKGLVLGQRYRFALSMSKVALCLVRKANSDGHVMRTFEVPACGAFMLAERTPDHAEMFREDEEAVFFGSPAEMVDKARYYASHDAARRRIAERGYARVTSGHNSYADRLRCLLQQIQ